MSGVYRGCQVKLFDYSHTAAPDYYAEHRHTLVMLSRPEEISVQWPNLALTPGSYLERYLVEYQEVDIANRTLLSRHYRLYALDVAQGLAWVGSARERWLIEHPGFYIEIRDNVLLAFHPEHDLESPEEIASLLSFAEALTQPGIFLPPDEPKDAITR